MVMEYLGIHGYRRSAYCESCFAAEMGDSSFEHTDMNRKTNSGNIFHLVSIYLPFATFMSPKDLHTFLLLLLLLLLFFFFFAIIKDPIRGECPSTKIAALDMKNLVFLVYHPLCMYK